MAFMKVGSERSVNETQQTSHFDAILHTSKALEEMWLVLELPNEILVEPLRPLVMLKSASQIHTNPNAYLFG